VLNGKKRLRAVFCYQKTRILVIIVSKKRRSIIIQYNRHNFAGASREVEVQITTIIDEVLLIDVKDFSASLN
jgi:hypothetical protein